MKIGLLTIHNVTNYGAILQAYASKKSLSEFGEVQLINYQNPHFKHHLQPIRVELSVRGLKMIFHDLLNIFFRSRMIKKFRKFIDHEYNLTSKYSPNSIRKWGGEGFSVLVCGSDQIWNPSIVGATNQFDLNYFLAFANKNIHKVAFASSMGNYQFSDFQKEKMISLLSEFKGIAVRENDGALFLKNLMPNHDIRHVLDPTLLLDSNSWIECLKPPTLDIPDNYILVYSVPRTALLRKAIKFFSKKYKLKVVAIDKMLLGMAGVDFHLRTVGPREFIGLFSNAQFIITDSFHGTCFSIIFQKPFVSIAASMRANRQESLLKKLGLLNRLVYCENEFNNISQDQSYLLVNNKLNELREESLGSLKNFIENIKR